MRVSAIITTFNRREYVCEAVRSAAEQTLAAHEIIVIVDGSTDGTAEALRDLFPGVKVIEQRNMGRSIARNHGMAVASGDWVAFLDDDDLWRRDKLSETAIYLSQNPECSALNHWFYYFADSDEGPSGAFGASRDFVAASLDECHAMALSHLPKNSFEYLDIRGNSFRLLLERNRGGLSASMVRREVAISAGGFLAAASYAEDWLFFLSVGRLAEWHTVPQPLGFQRLHFSQSTLEWQNGITILATKVAAWHTGRPAPGRQDWIATKAGLIRLSNAYRDEVQTLFWANLYAGRLRVAGTILHLGKLLLPRLRDRAYLFIPPSISWRFERYFLGLHK